MPSDARKRAQQKKKEQANNRNKNPVEGVTNAETNGATNGTTKEDRELTTEGTVLVPTTGMIRKNSHLRIGRYHQHLHELLDLDLSPLDYVMKEFPDVREREEMRKSIGRYGLAGCQQVCPMRQLSGGQRCRVVFAWLAWQTPHLLLMDEPTNHLDVETIDALADAVKDFDGGMVLVSHDFRLINQVAQEIWICENGAVTKWQGGILKYKDHLKSKILKDNADNAAKFRK